LTEIKAQPQLAGQDLAHQLMKGRQVMKAGDVMTRTVTTVQPTNTVAEALRRMLDGHISGLPVVDLRGHLVGIVTEGDFLRRVETGTDRPKGWFAFLRDPGAVAEDYILSHAKMVGDVMTREVQSVTESTPLEEVVSIMEKHKIKRVPVTHGKHLIGLISRSDLLAAVLDRLPVTVIGTSDDSQIYGAFMRELKKQSWAPRYAITAAVKNGVITLHGGMFDQRQREAIRVMAETIPGVKSVKDDMFWIEPTVGGLI
jgi:CBS domain-containing protein